MPGQSSWKSARYQPGPWPHLWGATHMTERRPRMGAAGFEPCHPGTHGDSIGSERFGPALGAPGFRACQGGKHEECAGSGRCGPGVGQEDDAGKPGGAIGQGSMPSPCGNGFARMSSLAGPCSGSDDSHMLVYRLCPWTLQLPARLEAAYGNAATMGDGASLKVRP
jgi:hypothetical protein